MPFTHTFRVRYNECDPQGIVFNANYFMYFDMTITELWRAAFGSYDAMVRAGTDIVVVDAGASFRAPARFDDLLACAIGVERFGTTSIAWNLTVSRDGDPLVTGRLVHVCIEAGTQTKKPIPDDVRDRIAAVTT